MVSTALVARIGSLHMPDVLANFLQALWSKRAESDDRVTL